METFFTTSDQIQHIIKSINLTKTLFVSSIIIGESNTGKKTLARYLFHNTPIISGINDEEVKQALEQYDELIISDFERLSNPNALDFDNKRIIATANYLGNPTLIDDLFAFIYTMPPLKERPKDADYLKTLFVKEACSTLMIDEKSIDISTIPLNLTMNNKSLKKFVFLDLVKLSMDATEIENVIYQYILKHLDGNNGYREHLGLYEKPLIQAGLKKYGSQLQLSEVLGINRNTLRKKIYEHHID